MLLLLDPFFARWMGQVGLEGLKGIFPTSYVELDFV
jgi:hypothetical protein